MDAYVIKHTGMKRRLDFKTTTTAGIETFSSIIAENESDSIVTLVISFDCTFHRISKISTWKFAMHHDHVFDICTGMLWGLSVKLWLNHRIYELLGYIFIFSRLIFDKNNKFYQNLQIITFFLNNCFIIKSKTLSLKFRLKTLE